MGNLQLAISQVTDNGTDRHKAGRCRVVCSTVGTRCVTAAQIYIRDPPYVNHYVNAHGAGLVGATLCLSDSDAKKPTDLFTPEGGGVRARGAGRGG